MNFGIYIVERHGNTVAEHSFDGDSYVTVARDERKLLYRAV